MSAELPATSSWSRLRRHAGTMLEWLALGVLVGVASGIASALFLHSLEWATAYRHRNEVLVFTLPLAGLCIGLVYERWGQTILGGNNLVLDTVHEGGTQIPLRMGPMVLVGTVLTHLFGGSAGREGTAVQMGASLADLVAHRFRVTAETRRQVLAAGIAGGFGSVFGTPLAGTVFGLEVVSVGKLEYGALFPALVSAVVGSLVTSALGVHHTHYPTLVPVTVTPMLLASWVLFGLVVAAVSYVFVELTHGIKKLLERRVPRLPLRMMLGGAVVVALWQLVGTSDYLGLGIPMIERSFVDPELPAYAFATKLVFTAVTLGSGYLGGEVTPLFFIGATLGNVFGRVMELPIDLCAAVGLAALFGAAANTPLALSIMAVELFGAAVLPHVAVVAVVAYLMTGHRGIYPSQRLLRRKSGEILGRPTTLRDYLEGEAKSEAKKEERSGKEEASSKEEGRRRKKKSKRGEVDPGGAP